ncbi:MAG TPA: hypothetical protein PK431_00385 [Chitinophagales bacterium]|nr:hypothetical protein [Chitinophagales bacterium]
MNWTIIIIFIAMAIALIVFLIYRNVKDEKEFEVELKSDSTDIKEEDIWTEINDSAR